MQYSRARWYDAKVGRFISEDPIGFRGKDINLYGYVWNSPIKLVDPKGKEGEGTLVLGGTLILGALESLGATVAAVTPPALIVGGGAVLIYGSYQIGEGIAQYRYPEQYATPPFPQAKPIPAIPPFPRTGDSCDAKPFPTFPPPAIPFVRSPPRRFEDPEDNRDGCKEEISACVQLCAVAEGDPSMRNIWGGSTEACLRGCISSRCQKGFRF